MKKRKIEGDADPNANNFRLKQAGDRLEEAQIAAAKKAMSKRLLARNVTTAKAVPPDKYSGKYKLSMLNRVTMISLTVQELEKQY